MTGASNFQARPGPRRPSATLLFINIVIQPTEPQPKIKICDLVLLSSNILKYIAHIQRIVIMICNTYSY